MCRRAKHTVYTHTSLSLSMNCMKLRSINQHAVAGSTALQTLKGANSGGKLPYIWRVTDSWHLIQEELLCYMLMNAHEGFVAYPQDIVPIWTKIFKITVKWGLLIAIYTGGTGLHGVSLIVEKVLTACVRATVPPICLNGGFIHQAVTVHE